jgi:hypothetical protein
MKKTVIMHFYNEAKMLKWWLPHHTELFDEGILINHSSTDGSVDICRSIAPHWRVIDTELTDFNAIENDLEVMKHEATVDGWKMVLNATEFLVCRPNKLNAILRGLKSENKSCLQTRGVIMVDDKPQQIASEQNSLVQQKCHGYIEDERPNHGRKFSSLLDLYYHHQINSNKRRSRKGFRNRIIHSHVTGDYEPGRHSTKHNIESIYEPLYTFWYGFSPWEQAMISRKQQFKNRIPKADFEKKFGYQHFWREAKLQEEYEKHLTKSGDLTYLLT